MGQWNSVELEANGRTYAGKYRVEGGIITVTYDAEGGGNKAMHVGDAEPAELAKRMLLEVVSELRNKKQ